MKYLYFVRQGLFLFVTLICSLYVTKSFAQADKLKKKAMNTNHITLTNTDSVEIFYLSATQRNTSKRDGFYWWYGASSIKMTQGAVAGRVLDGEYSLFTKNKDLLERGMYSNGQREGIWRQWYKQGSLKRRESWKKGRKEGAFVHYYTDGRVQLKGAYDNNQLHGVVKEYNVEGKIVKHRYRYGNLLLPKGKKIKVKDSKIKTDLKNFGLRLKEVSKPKEIKKSTDISPATPSTRRKLFNIKFFTRKNAGLV